MYGPRIKEMKERVKKMQHEYAKTMEPLYERTRELEKQLDEVEGKKNIQERIGESGACSLGIRSMLVGHLEHEQA